MGIDEYKPLYTITPGNYPVYTGAISEGLIGVPETLQSSELMQLVVSLKPEDHRDFSGNELFVELRKGGGNVYLEPVIDQAQRADQGDDIVVRNHEVLVVPEKDVLPATPKRT